MSRAFCIPGVLFLLAAFVLNLLVSISLPFLPALDIARTKFGNGVSQPGSSGVTQIRFGIWAPCYYDSEENRTCRKTGHGYNVQISNGADHTANIKSSVTRGLAVHPVAAAVTLVALLLSFSTHITITLIASLVSFLAALLTLIAFAIDIAAFVLIRAQMNHLNVNANTDTAPGFWMTLVALVLLLLAGCTVCFGRRRDRMSSATTTSTYPAKGGFFSRFRRNRY